MFTTFLTAGPQIMLWSARVLGKTYRWLGSEWRRPAWWLLIIALGMGLGERLFSLQPGTWFEGWKVLGVYATLLVLGVLWRARGRTVIEDFADNTGDKNSTASSGLSTLLVAELARLRDLYRVVEEDRPRESLATDISAGKPIEATVQVQDVSEFLKGAVSAESKVSLGPFQIPLGFFLALLGRLVQGPRIIGSLHQEGSHLILVVQMSGTPPPNTWRVDSALPAGESLDQARSTLDEMIAELACRMFTDKTLGGSVRWKATEAFNMGLRLYRDSLRVRKGRKLKLLQAEKKFIEALAEDDQFDLAFYNLGIIYNGLDKLKTAQTAFSEAISRSPQRWGAYYALAKQHFHSGQYDLAIELCNRVIAVEPHQAQAYDLKGYVQRLNGDPQGALSSRRRAVALAWQALYLAEFRQSPARAQSIAKGCLCNLGVSYVFQAQKSKGFKRWLAFHLAEAQFRQAQFLAPSDPRAYFELGKTFHEWEKRDWAEKEFMSALRIDPSNSQFWAYLALEQAYQKNADATRTACDRVLDCASGVSKDALTQTAKAYELIEAHDASHRVLAMQDLQKDIEALCKKESAVQDLKDKLGQYERDGREWEYAQIAIALGQLQLGCKSYLEAETLFKNAIEKLKGHPQEIRKQGLWAWVARAYRMQGRYPEALQAAEEALWTDPLSSFERRELGEVYFALGDLERARSAWEDALLWKPDDVDIHSKIGACYIRLAGDCRESAQRAIYMQQGIQYLEQALELFEGKDIAAKVWALYWLGLFHFQLGKYEKAISYLRIAEGHRFEQLAVTYQLGWACLESKAYDECEEQLRKGIQIARKSIKDDQDPNAIVVGAGIGDPRPLSEVLAMMHLTLAFSYGERDARLTEALDLVDRAAEYVKKIADNTARNRCEAAQADCKGWILYKQHQIEEALLELEHAISLTAEGATYWRLAVVTEHKMQECPAETPQSLAERVEAYCQHAQELDVWGKYSKRIEELKQKLIRDQQAKTKNEAAQKKEDKAVL